MSLEEPGRARKSYEEPKGTLQNLEEPPRTLERACLELLLGWLGAVLGHLGLSWAILGPNIGHLVPGTGFGGPPGHTLRGSRGLDHGTGSRGVPQRGLPGAILGVILGTSLVPS